MPAPRPGREKVRNEFHAELVRLEEQLVAMGEIADQMLGDAVGALRAADADAAERVIHRDGEVDQRYVSVQQGVLRAIALQAPVASDLRLIAAMLHTNIHLERMGDYATSVARMVMRSAALPDDPDIAEQIDEMAEHARRVGREAMRAFTTRNADLARQLPELDDAVDQLNIGIFKRLVRLARLDDEKLKWAERLMITPRLIERYGDHAVDIGEQIIFAVDGELVELSSNAPRD